MATRMTGGPRRRASDVLSRDDVEALFHLMSRVVYDPNEEEDLAYTGRALASWFEAYGAHLLKLLGRWDELSEALQSEDALSRAAHLHDRLREIATAGPLVGISGRRLRSIQDPQAHEVRSLILGKGMEI